MCVCEAMHPLSYTPLTSTPKSLLVGNDNLALLDSNNDVVGVLAVNSATNRVSGTEDFTDTTRKVLGERLVGHLTGNVVNLVKGDVTGVLDVLLLLPVPRRLLEGLDDKGRGGRNNGDGSLPVLDSELDSHSETFPVTSGLGNVFSDLLGGETKGTDLGGQSGRGTDLTTGRSEVDDLFECRI